jgi:hypothetical protein
VTDHAAWLFSSLGVEGDHSKIINSIVAVADGRLVWFQTNQQRLHERGYDLLNPDWAASRDKVKGNRVGRDLRAFVDALEAAGLVKKRFRKDKFSGCEGILDYKCGRTGVNSWMRANFLRYMGQAFARVSSIRRERMLKWAWEARKEATLEIALTIPRYEVDSAIRDKKIEAKIRAEGQSGQSLMQEAKRQLAKELKQFWTTMRNAGFSLEEIDAEMQDEYLSAVSWGLEQENEDSEGINLHVHQFGGHVS